MRTFVTIIVVALGMLSNPLSCAATECARPNIVFLLVDDMPYAAMSTLGNEWLETPAMDRIAKEGMFFSQAYSENLCAPSRASIMRGQWSARHHRTDVVPGVHPQALMKEPPVPMGVWEDTYTLQKALRAGGYTTAMIGKWHLPWNAFPPDQELANRYGFDFTQRRLDKKAYYKESPIFIEEALYFLREKRDPVKPFYLYFAFQTVHGPHTVPKADQNRWAKRLEGKKCPWMPDMLASLEHTDRCVGRVLDALDELDLTANTLVVLSSDNGGLTGRVYSEENKPLRMGKGSLYEGGVRVPLAFRWPGHIKPGSRCDTPVHFVDLFPTFCDVAGVAIDPKHHLDGVSLKPLFSGNCIPDRTIFLHYPHYVAKWGTTPVRAVIRKRFKLVVNPFDHIEINGERIVSGKYVPKPRIELFDLEVDPPERHNIAAQHPETVVEMRKALDAWLRETGARDATPNPDYDPEHSLVNARDVARGRGERLPNASTQLSEEKP